MNILIPGLNSVASLVLRLACESMIENDSRADLETESLLSKAESRQVGPDEFFYSLINLERNGHAKITWLSGESRIEGHRIGILQITDSGFQQYIKACIPNYPAIRNSVTSQIVDHGAWEERHIVDAIGQPRLIVRQIMKTFVKLGFIKCNDLRGRGFVITEASPELKRRFGSGQ